MKKIGILGSGTWGTALANLLASHQQEVTLYSKFEEESKLLKETQKHPHLKCDLHDSIKFTSDIQEACEGMDIVIFASPSPYIRASAESAKPYLKPSTIIVTVAKGIEPDTLYFMSDILSDVLGPEFKIASLSGPTHAEEVSVLLPTLIVAASDDLKVAQAVQEACSHGTFRVYTNHDIKGVELCGALKNIVALAAGLSDGLGFGDNSKAAIISRGLVEIRRLGIAMGCDEQTFCGLAGIGDIIVTATSVHSRNNRAGYLMGQGKTLDETLKEVGMVVEGVNALKAAKELMQKYQVELPIIEAVYKVVYDGIPAKEVVLELFSRKTKHETE